MAKTRSRTKQKLPSGGTARAVKEWVGKTPDTRPPASVQLRILERQGGKCAVTGHKFRVGDKRLLDHKIALADGGENREGNLQWILDWSHLPKTKAEAAVRAKVRAQARKHAGIKTPPARPMESRNDLPTGGKEKKATKLPVTSAPSEMARRYQTETGRKTK